MLDRKLKIWLSQQDFILKLCIHGLYDFQHGIGMFRYQRGTAFARNGIILAAAGKRNQPGLRHSKYAVQQTRHQFDGVDALQINI